MSISSHTNAISVTIVEPIITIPVERAKIYPVGDALGLSQKFPHETASQAQYRLLLVKDSKGWNGRMGLIRGLWQAHIITGVGNVARPPMLPETDLSQADFYRANLLQG